MRVIAGKYGSRRLRSLRGVDIRPTSDRLRETLFNVLTAGNFFQRAAGRKPDSTRGQCMDRLVRRYRSGRDRSTQPWSQGSVFRGIFRERGGTYSGKSEEP